MCIENIQYGKVYIIQGEKELNWEMSCEWNKFDYFAIKFVGIFITLLSTTVQKKSEMHNAKKDN